MAQEQLSSQFLSGCPLNENYNKTMFQQMTKNNMFYHPRKQSLPAAIVIMTQCFSAKGQSLGTL